VRQHGEEHVLGAIGLGRFAIELCVLQEDAGEIAQALEQADFPFRDRAARRPPDHEESADGPILDADRHEQIGLMRKLSKGLRIDARIARHVVGPYRAPCGPGLLDRGMVLERNRNPAEGVQHAARYPIAGHRPEALARGIGEIGADRVGAERHRDLPRDAAHRLRGVERRAQRPAHGEQRFGLAQAQLLRRWLA
jgi:hypothetical protein